MHHSPAISVILPFHNAERTLGSAVQSILDQTFTDFELLLIDNCSVDNSLTIAGQCAQKDKRIRLLSEENKGVAHAMNCGLANARGEFIARMDADDLAYPERLEKQVRFMVHNPEIRLVGSEVQYVPHDDNTEGFRRFVEWVNSFCSPEEIALNRFVEIPVVNPTLLFHKSVYEELGGCLQGSFPEDYEMLLRYLDAGIKMAKIPEPLLEWHDYSTRLTRTDERYSTVSFIKTKAVYFKKWLEQNSLMHRPLWIWGAGRKTRQRARLLVDEGLQIEGYIDIDKSKTTRKNVIHNTDIPDAGKIFILSMVTKPGAGQKIRSYLKNRNYIEGRDFMLMG